jgi:N-acetylmuramoyl-L-alanine amidase
LHRSAAILLFALTSFATAALPYSAAQAPPGLRILSRDGSRVLPTTAVNNNEYVPLDEVANTFGLALKEDRLAGGITVASGTRTLIITPDQPVVSVAGRLVSLAAPPIRQANRWLVPLDFLQRAVGPLLDLRVELRRASRLVIVGDLRVPRVNVRVDGGANGATATFEITPSAGTKVTSDSGRLVVTFEADALDLQTPASLPAQDFLQAVQQGDAPATVRLVTGPRFGVHRATTSQPDASSARLSIELLPAGAEAPAVPPPTAAPPPPPPEDPLPIPVPTVGLRTVVIDPGHGGDESGVRGSGGALEKDVTLQIARRLRTMIEGRLGLRVFLTRDDDRMMSLDDRSAYANSQKADVFISIHANAALRPAMRGAEVYYLSVESSTASASGEQPGSAVLPTLGGGTRSIDMVLWETAQARSLEQSSALANLVEQALRSRVEMSPRAVQQAPFRVLVGATMPAVLIEVGYLSNPEQEQALTSGGFQDQIAQSLFEALVRFRAQIDRSGRRLGQ